MRISAHGLMFHHFHDGKQHIKSQGSITGAEFEAILRFYQKKHKIISAREWQRKALANALLPEETCVTFDDSLRCQFDIALPILKKLRLKAFWFIYTAPLVGEIEKLEIYRYFRFKEFKNIGEFYKAFDRAVQKSDYGKKIAAGLKKFDSGKTFRIFPIFTKDDKKFRYIRDSLLSKKEFEEIMDHMIKDSKIELDRVSKSLWLNKRQVRELYKMGHVIGLHSHTHPTNLKKMSRERQKEEYEKNFSTLTSILGKKGEITSMSHPANSYNKNVLGILKGLGVKIGFRATMDKFPFSKLEYPRLDHAYLIKKVRK